MPTTTMLKVVVQSFFVQSGIVLDFLRAKICNLLSGINECRTTSAHSTLYEVAVHSNLKLNSAQLHCCTLRDIRRTLRKSKLEVAVKQKQ